MEYLERVLGIRVVYQEDEPGNMPNYIASRYRIRKVTLDGKEALFLYPKTELDSVSTIKKQIDRIGKVSGVPVVLVLENLTYRKKEYLLRERIPFIVEGKQIYLPFFAVYLQERGDGEKLTTESLLPSAQLLLLCYIYHGCGEFPASEAEKELNFTATSISRASRQLEELGLIHLKKQGVQKIIYSDRLPEELFSDAEKVLKNPVKRTIFVPKSEIHKKLLLSRYSALSEYSMLNPPETYFLATDSVAAWETVSSGTMQDTEDQYAVELWRYDPKKLADGKCVDRLSLSLSLRDDKDERVEEAVEEMLNGVWRYIDGSRN